MRSERNKPVYAIGGIMADVGKTKEIIEIVPVPEKVPVKQ